MMRTIIPTFAFVFFLYAMGYPVNAKAADDRNDMMCTAVFITAQAQAIYNLGEAAKAKDSNEARIQDLHRKYYGTRVALLNWSLENSNPTSYDLTRYTNFAQRYADEMDTATALLHLDRCERRIFVLWTAYMEKKNG